MLSRALSFIEKKIPEPIINLISLISGFISILGWVAKGLIIVLNIQDSSKNTLLEKILTILKNKYFLFGSTVIFIFLLIIKCCEYYMAADIRLYNYPKRFHEALHQYRDLRFQINKELEKKTLRYQDVVNYISDYSVYILDSLCDMVSEIIKRPVYGCIKLVDFNGGVEMKDISVSTFRRSSNTSKGRCKIAKRHKDYVIDNTDYMELMDHNVIRNQFYQPDLIEYDKGLRKDDHEYKNSSSNWKEHYLSTVVVPIQILRQFLANGEKDAYNVIGFLCLDSKERNSFRIKYKEPICNLMKAYADLLYCVFELYRNALEQVINNDKQDIE